MYPIIDVPADAAVNLEPLGTKQKFWFVSGHPDLKKLLAPASETWLFKLNRGGCGDDWAEKISCELCAALRIPHARYELARWNAQRGVVSESIVPEGGRLVLGNELLPTILREYAGGRRFKNRQHTLNRVLGILGSDYVIGGHREALRRPLGAKAFAGVKSAPDFFVGYLMLDALVANQDRHHENWALLVSAEPAVHLSATFDHASSLGTGETDESRRDRLTTHDRNRSVRAFVRRARSALYKSEAESRPFTTIEAFAEASRRFPDAGTAWLNRLKKLPVQAFDRILESVPTEIMSDLAKDFVKEMLLLNRDRLLEL